MYPKLDWSKISQAYYGYGPFSFTLDNSEVKLLLSLMGHATNQWAWLNDGAALTAAEWDEAEAMVSRLNSKLMGTDDILCRFDTDLDGFAFYSSTGSGVWTLSQDPSYNGSAKFDVTGETAGDRGRIRKDVNVTIQPNHWFLALFKTDGKLYHVRYKLRDESDNVIVQFGSGDKTIHHLDQSLETWAGQTIRVIEAEAEAVETGGTIYFEYFRLGLV